MLTKSHMLPPALINSFKKWISYPKYKEISLRVFWRVGTIAIDYYFGFILLDLHPCDWLLPDFFFFRFPQDFLFLQLTYKKCKRCHLFTPKLGCDLVTKSSVDLIFLFVHLSTTKTVTVFFLLLVLFELYLIDQKTFLGPVVG